MKTYVLIISTLFPKTHPKAGEPTLFVEKIMSALADTDDKWKMKADFINYDWHEYYNCTMPKYHTIRGNWPLWEKRIIEIRSGKACLSIRIWSGKPYNSKQIEVTRITGMQVYCEQLLKFSDGYWVNGEVNVSEKVLAANDGLNVSDFQAWFKNYPDEAMAVIHFTNNRYTGN